jgi:multiple sugar transport system substrate-binding protein
MKRRPKSVLSASVAALAVCLGAAQAGAADVSFSLWQYGEPALGTWWKSVVDGYEQATGDHIVIRNRPISEYNPQLVVELASAAAADLILVSTSHLNEYAASGNLMQLDEYVKGGPIYDRIQDGGWNSMTVDGHIYAVPIAGRTLELIYNKCYFDEAGIAGPPTTPQEYLDAARKLVQRDESGNVTRYGTNMINTSEDPTYELLLMWTIAFGGTHFTDADGNWQLTSKPVVDALTFMKTLYDEGLVPKAVMESDQRAMFATGQSAMTIDGQWQFPFIQENNAANYDCYQAARHPWAGSATGGANTALAVNANAVEPEKALAFLEFVTRPDYFQTFADYSPLIPLGRGSLTQAQIDAKPYIKPWLDSIRTATPIPPPGHADQMSQVWPIIADAMISSFQDGIAPADALAAAQAELEECCSE